MLSDSAQRKTNPKSEITQVKLPTVFTGINTTAKSAPVLFSYYIIIFNILRKIRHNSSWSVPDSHCCHCCSCQMYCLDCLCQLLLDTGKQFLQQSDQLVTDFVASAMHGVHLKCPAHPVIMTQAIFTAFTVFCYVTKPAPTFHKFPFRRQ